MALVVLVFLISFETLCELCAVLLTSTVQLDFVLKDFCAHH